MSGWLRTRGHKLGREAERLEPLHEANNKVGRLVQREFPSQTLCVKSNTIRNMRVKLGRIFLRKDNGNPPHAVLHKTVNT
jgi:hypothetical protein